MSIQFGDPSHRHSGSHPKPTVTFNGQQVPVDNISISYDSNNAAATYDFTSATISGALQTVSGSFAQLGEAFVQASGCVAEFPGTPAIPCQHVVTDSLIEYQDDLVIAYCTLCEARMTLLRVPGGVNKLKMTNILAIMRENPDVADDQIEAILDLERQVEDEIAELQNALLLLTAAKDQACRSLLP